jgi:thiosulfate/3-mercaptopyruvate sulfurtransferase
MPRTYADPNAVITAEDLEANLSAPNLRVFECTQYLIYETGTGRPYTVKSGREDYESAHIPGAAFIDLQKDLSIDDSPYRFTLPAPEDLAARFAAAGIGEDFRVVLYSRDKMQWATRIWWMLRYVGFDKAAVLDGGWTKWVHDGRRQEPGRNGYGRATLTPRPRPDLFVGREAMLDAIGNVGTCSLNALAADLHSGADPRYGRPGRIPGSVNIPATSLVDPVTQEFKPLDDVAAAFASVGADPDKRILNYCGGGIAATLDAFLQYQLGYDRIAVYDNSMSEWAKDESLPIEAD